MVRIEFLGPIGKEPLDLNISNLSELSEILKKDDSLSIWLKNSACAINDVLTNDKNAPLNDGDKVTMLPPVCGG
ncbi:MoaD/ThiS family protein [Arcobacter sp. 15-2]|uniref:MoaD/ThiS family protein n=1 Tax=Arcobacter sp. 15-2 TaxID=3374109 RepID=UPI00399C9B6D